jgi:alpha-tubulin suppressor-like RCC1 family protein
LLSVATIALAPVFGSACVESPTGPSNVDVKYVSITAGSDHTCGLTSSGEVYCWGGQAMGDDFIGPGPSTIVRTRPAAVGGGLRFAALSASSGHTTCGITVSGATYCWDMNLNAVAVPGGVRFAALAAADGTTCGVDVGQVTYCWGDNNSLGQLANGNFAPAGSASPVAIAGDKAFTQVVASTYGDACALTAEGVAYCWGQNGWGQLGDGTQTNRSTPVPVSGGVTFSAISAGWVHTCGLTSGGAAYCWGAGQFVDGSANHILAPVAVSGDVTFRTISAGSDHTCGLAFDGSAYCWGQDPASAEAGVPAAVPGGFIFTSLATGGDHACGLTLDGTAYCWGQNGLGQLGDGALTDQSAPVRVLRP